MMVSQISSQINYSSSMEEQQQQPLSDPMTHSFKQETDIKTESNYSEQLVA